MKYIAIVHKDEESAYGVTLPDFPGCFSAGDTLDALQANVQEAVELWAEDQLNEPPVPLTFEVVATLPEAAEGVLMLLDVDFSFLNTKAVALNITVPEYMRARIDRAAKGKGLSRSAYLARAAEAFGA